MVSLEFFIDVILPAALCPGVDSACNKWVPVKAAGALCWQPYHLYVPIVLKSGSLNLLEPPGPVQACNGIALPFPIHLTLFFSLRFTLSSGPFNRSYLNEFDFFWRHLTPGMHTVWLSWCAAWTQIRMWSAVTRFLIKIMYTFLCTPRAQNFGDMYCTRRLALHS
jgi:hypothetical protein